MNLSNLDISVIVAYTIFIVVLAQYVSREPSGRKKTAKDYFLASKSLPWWAVGSSLVAANISAEQIIGMSGSGYAIGLGIASYEWLAAITLLVVGKYFLPIFLRREIYTMPQFLEMRFDHSVRLLLTTFWLGVYVFVNLTSVLWLGALAVNRIAGLDMFYATVALGALSLIYSLYGGLKAVALTDIVQVLVLVLGGAFILYLTMDQLGDGNGIIAGISKLAEEAPEKFDMILSPDNPHYASLPGLSVLLGGMWVMHFSYWGFNQYIIQRALAAKSIGEAQKGIVFAAALKVLMPLIVVLPGMAAFILTPNLPSADHAYPEMMALLPSGIRGLVFAGLIAAILSSLGSMVNSISTLFTMDIYRHLRPSTSQTQLVVIGRLVATIAIVVAVFSAKPLLGKFDQAFQYIQEFTGFFTPGIVVIFVLGMFWTRATTRGALAAAAGSAVLSLLIKVFWPQLPFIDRVGIVFLCCLLLAVSISLWQNPESDPKAIPISDISFETTRAFNTSAVGIALLLAAFYVTWW